MPVLRGIGTLARCCAGGGQCALHEVSDAALVFDEDEVIWAGPEDELPQSYAGLESWDAAGGLVTPGLVDCHTHLAFGGWRADEFEQRVCGAGYREIARAGGGIASTVRATRDASHEALVAKALPMLDEMAALGMTTVECKSGYGLCHDQELKLLEVYRELDELQPLSLVSTFLGAHVVPPEHRDDRQTYLASLRERTLPEIAERGLAEFCDVFVEDAAYTIDEARRVFEAASSLGLRPKLHADQLGNGGGAALAAEVAAVSADHLEHASDEGLARMAQANVVGVALPFASLYTFQPPLDARRLVEAGVAVAVSTDFNPGTAPSYHLPMALHLACTLNRLTPAQALKGATVYAARALGREGRIGSLEPGKAPDFALFDAPDVNHWLYRVREGTCRLTVKAGRAVHGRPEPWRAE